VPRPFRDATQWPLRRGTDLVLETHMLPTGRPEAVDFRVGLYFTGEPPTRRPVVVRLGSEALDIPAADASYRVGDDFVVPIDVEAVMVFPHAHYLARQVRGWAELPDGSRQELIWIRDWDFNWQGSYHYAEPMALPAGTRLRAELVFDNSADNPLNPHQPPRRVLWGPRSSDEMADLWVQLLPRREGEGFLLAAEAARHRAQIVRRAQEARLRRDPGDADAHTLLGDVLLELGETVDAIAHYRESLRLRPGVSAVENQMASALLGAGKVDEALGLYAGALEREPDNHQVRVNLAMALAVSGRLEAAEAELRRALELGPGSIEAHLNLGAVLNDLGRPAEARRHLERAVGMRPESATAHFNLANALRGLGELGMAERHYRESMRLDPAYPAAYNNLGVLLGGQGRLEEAAELFRRALALDPEHADARANLAAVERARRGG
jgi:tetratricopeptide (TPR) repeat protein